MQKTGWLVATLLALAISGCDSSLSSSYSYSPVQREAYRPTAEPRTTETTHPVPETTEVKPTVPLSEPKVSATKASPVVPPAETVSTPKYKLVRGNPSVKKIALTFDDGPHDGYTQDLIRVLREFNVPATFFLIGRNVVKHPELAKLAKENGFELANHTYSHTRLASLTDDEIRAELLGGADEIAKATGFRPTFFRPPGGEYDKRVEAIAAELSMTMVLWTADAGDFTTPFGNPSPQTIEQKVLRYVSPGGIIIMHDPMPGTLKVLPSLITSLRALGYEFVTVSELASDPKAITWGGPRIKSSHKSAVQAISEQGRYPTVTPFEETNASPEQRTASTTSPQGAADQGIDPGSEGGKNDQKQERRSQSRQGH